MNQIDVSTLYPDASFVARLVRNSTLHDRIGQLTDPDYLTDPSVVLVSMAYDASGSMNDYDLVQAVLQGNALLLGNLVNTKDSPRLVGRQTVYSNEVSEVTPWQRLSNPTNRRELITKPLNRATYDPSRGSGTNTVLALQDAIAEHLLLEAYLDQPGVKIKSRHVVCLLTDGFPTHGSQEEFLQLRDMFRDLSSRESWRFLAFGMMSNATVRHVQNILRQAGFDVSLAQARDIYLGATLGGYSNKYGLSVPEEIYETHDKSSRQSQVDTWFETAVQGLGDEADRLTARQYRVVERWLITDSGIPIPEGGMGFPVVHTSELTPGAVAELIGSTMSTSVAAASEAIAGQDVRPSAPVAVAAPAETAPPQPEDDVFDLEGEASTTEVADVQLHDPNTPAAI